MKEPQGICQLNGVLEIFDKELSWDQQSLEAEQA